MIEGAPTRVIAASLGLGAFAVSIIAGMAADNPLDQVLSRALVALVACVVVGSVLGTAAEWAIRQHIAQTKSSPPAQTEQPTAQNAS